MLGIIPSGVLAAIPAVLCCAANAGGSSTFFKFKLLTLVFVSWSATILTDLAAAVAVASTCSESHTLF
uniref:Putative product n=1 Tax=Xenopsylla cheopis TaxID=163159 RepID=A0A6M2DXP8_XENCH